MTYDANVLILNLATITENELEKILSSKINLLVLLNESQNIHTQIITNLGFEIRHQKNNLVILKNKEN